MKRLTTVIIIIILLSVARMNAQDMQKGQFTAEKNVIDGGYNFWVYTPGDYEHDGHPLPLIIFLHGASLCGNNMQRVLRYGTLDAIQKGMRIPMLVVAPQNPGGAWKPSKLNDMLEWVKDSFNVDSNRVYVLGMSLGGYGTLDFTAAYPEKVAAAMALCGGCSMKDVTPLGSVPLWIMHGTADRAVGLQNSKRVVSQLQSTGNDHRLRYDWVKGGSHALLARMFYLQKTYDWLISHSLLDNPKEVDNNFSITRDDMSTSYRSLRIDLSQYEKD